MEVDQTECPTGLHLVSGRVSAGEVVGLVLWWLWLHWCDSGCIVVVVVKLGVLVVVLGW